MNFAYPNVQGKKTQLNYVFSSFFYLYNVLSHATDGVCFSIYEGWEFCFVREAVINSD